MAAVDLVIKKGNTAPLLEATLMEGASEAALGTPTSVTLLMEKVGTSGSVKRLTAAWVSGGKVKYEWKGTSEDSGGAAGQYSIEWEVKLASGKLLNFPSEGVRIIEIQSVLE